MGAALEVFLAGGKFEQVYVDKSSLKINNIVFDLDYLIL